MHALLSADGSTEMAGPVEGERVRATGAGERSLRPRWWFLCAAAIQRGWR
jgi:hypothetical protein